jgi:hypothetical protein
MHHRSSVVAFVALSASAAVLTACAGRTPRQVAPAPAALDSVAARLVDLELERVSSNAVPAPQTGSPRQLNSEIAELHDRLRALPNGAAADQEATQRVVLALGARASSLGTRLQQLRLVYTDTHPVVRQVLDEERFIEQRLSEIRSQVNPHGERSRRWSRVSRA